MCCVTLLCALAQGCAAGGDRDGVRRLRTFDEVWQALMWLDDERFEVDVVLRRLPEWQPRPSRENLSAYRLYLPQMDTAAGGIHWRAAPEALLHGLWRQRAAGRQAVQLRLVGRFEPFGCGCQLHLPDDPWAVLVDAEIAAVKLGPEVVRVCVEAHRDTDAEAVLDDVLR